MTRLLCCSMDLDFRLGTGRRLMWYNATSCDDTLLLRMTEFMMHMDFRI